MIIISFWMIPRMMDEALPVPAVEIFKFFSLRFLTGVPFGIVGESLPLLGKTQSLTA
ncbi:hypothetical protein [Oceanobacillus salinisoli]|uniref:hypothetical protein n=1 Tax=Oceanobacillus salinisoli TaxID=2678611 RepID=UPI0012E1A600|nr:hypothetical protein [Oceanobacillus salinisoli]